LIATTCVPAQLEKRLVVTSAQSASEAVQPSSVQEAPLDVARILLIISDRLRLGALDELRLKGNGPQQ
jgi:hypothetical protein